MNLFWSIITFFMIWWVAIFAVLPWGIRHSQQPEAGMLPGTPLQPNLKKIFLRTTLVAFALWLVVYGIAEFDLLSFRRLAQAMHRQLEKEGKE